MRRTPDIQFSVRVSSTVSLESLIWRIRQFAVCSDRFTMILFEIWYLEPEVKKGFEEFTVTTYVSDTEGANARQTISFSRIGNHFHSIVWFSDENLMLSGS